MKKIGIKALIFDYGGVITESHDTHFFHDLIQRLGVSQDRFLDIYYQERVNYDNGQLSGEEYWRKVLQACGMDPAGANLNRLIQADVNSWTQLNRDVICFIDENRARVEKLAIISNMIRDTLTYIHDHFDWLKYFDHQTYSCEIGINKPDLRIYEHCLNGLAVSPHESLFVDDSDKNVQGAVKSGMNVIHYKSFAQFSQEIEQKYEWIQDPI